MISKGTTELKKVHEFIFVQIAPSAEQQVAGHAGIYTRVSMPRYTSSTPGEHRILAFNSFKSFNNDFSLMPLHALGCRVTQIPFQVICIT